MPDQHALDGRDITERLFQDAVARIDGAEIERQIVFAADEIDRRNSSGYGKARLDQTAAGACLGIDQEEAIAFGERCKVLLRAEVGMIKIRWCRLVVAGELDARRQTDRRTICSTGNGPNAS
jgi:hypothetical protein